MIEGFAHLLKFHGVDISTEQTWQQTKTVTMRGTTPICRVTRKEAIDHFCAARAKRARRPKIDNSK